MFTNWVSLPFSLKPRQYCPSAHFGNLTAFFRVKQSTAFNLLRRLREYADAVLLFIRDPDVPFTNNLGERAVRMPKVKQKISGCFRTLEGADNFCVIRSCLDTFKKQGHSMLDVLQRAFHGDPIWPAA
jgi:transposase